MVRDIWIGITPEISLLAVLVYTLSIRVTVNSTSSQVNVTDLKEAEIEIIKQVQRDEFPSEIKSLQDIQEKYGSRKSDKEKEALFKMASSLRMLDPVLYSDGVMRVGGRIRKANLPRALKNPVILPKSSPISSWSSVMFVEEHIIAEEG